MDSEISGKAMDKIYIHSSEDIKFQLWKESTETLISSIVNQTFQPFSIGIVPDELRKWNEKAYIPKVVSIGPRYKGSTRNIVTMEEIKWYFMMVLPFNELMMLFFHQAEEAPERGSLLHSCLTEILKLDVTVRGSYTDEIKLDRYELGATMLNDGCFLLVLLIIESEKLQEKLKYFGTRTMKLTPEDLFTDIVLLENQIPLIVLKVLATTIFPKTYGVGYTFESLVRSFLGLSLDSSFHTDLDEHAGHFLELVYVSIFENSQVQNNQESHHSDNVVVTKLPIDDEEPRDVNVKLNRCATRLQAAGVTIIVKTADTVNPRTSFNFDIEFKDGKLEIPRLHITERAEARWRNFIAWEHHKMKGNNLINMLNPDKPLNKYKCKCTMAALLFNGLVCCPSDVQLLKDKKVIVDQSNMSNQDLVDLFSSIPKGVDPSIIDSSYVKMFHDLNTYPATPYVIRTPIILWHYLTRIPEVIYCILRFFRKDYNFAAALITSLTVIQTYYTVLSYYDPKH